MLTTEASIISQEAAALAEASSKMQLKNQLFYDQLMAEELKQSIELNCDILDIFKSIKRKNWQMHA